jgi:hypothetical protein
VNHELTVITLTNGKRSEWLEKCCDSINSFLPKTAKHLIVQCKNYEETDTQRLISLNHSKYITFVDDDDWIINDSLNICLDLIKSKQLGLVFTDEIIINKNGLEQPPHGGRGKLFYSDLINKISTAHQLAIYKTDPVLEELRLNPLNCSSRIEYWMKAVAGLREGALHVPINGYCWRHHSDNRSANIEEINLYKNKFSIMRDHLTKAYGDNKEVIPRHEF